MNRRSKLDRGGDRLRPPRVEKSERLKSGSDLTNRQYMNICTKSQEGLFDINLLSGADVIARRRSRARLCDPFPRPLQRGG
jgi:hypothetical protein